MSKPIEARLQSPLDLNRIAAIAGLRSYLSSPAERVLHLAKGREHQATSLDKLLAFWESGETAGFFDLPTGTGKTVIDAGIIRATRLNTIVTAPTGTILDKTKSTIEAIVPEASVTVFDGRSKSVAGNVICTTPNSLDRLAAIPAIAQGVQLITVDENDLGTLSAQRYKLWRQFPNALIIGLTATPDFSQLQELIERGLVDPNERWIGAFSNEIHKMTREEAMRRGALTPLDIHLFRTRQTIGDVNISAKGRYDRDEIDQFLNTEARNMLVLALVAGLDALPADVVLPDDLREDIRDTHQKIQGKRTIIFGLSIKHIEDLAVRLRAHGVNAAAVSGKMDTKQRDIINQAHQSGRLPVVLTDELFRRGWDSPPTEVGIFADVTQSETALAQGLGRIQRTSPETGKERAIAIQLIDDTTSSATRPVYLPELFDPDFVLEGTKSLREPSNRSGEREEKPKLTITAERMNIDALIDELTSEDLLKRRFEGSTVDTINAFFDSVIVEFKDQQEDIPILSFYQKIAEVLPSRMSHVTQQMVLNETRDIEGEKPKSEEKKRQARRAFILMNMRGILSIIGSHFTNNEANNEDIIHEALEVVYNNMDSIDLERNITFQLRQMLGIGRLPLEIANNEGIPVELVRERRDGTVIRRIDARIAERDGLDEEGVYDFAEDLSDTTGHAPEKLAEVIAARNARFAEAVPKDQGDDSLREIVLFSAQRDTIEAALETLSEREATVLRLRFGLDGEPHTLDEAGKVFGRSRELIRQVEKKALSKLRRRLSSKTLRDLLSD